MNNYPNLQACVNAQANKKGGGSCVVDDAWFNTGGTQSEIANVKTYNSEVFKKVFIVDRSHGRKDTWGVRP